MNPFKIIGRWLGGLFTKKTIEDALSIKTAVSGKIEDARSLWRSMYEGAAAWNGDDIPSLQIAASLCTEAARSVTLEFKSDVSDPNVDGVTTQLRVIPARQTRAKWLDKCYQSTLTNLRQTVEKACAGGEVILHPYVENQTLFVGVVESNHYFPVAYDKNGDLNHVVFADTMKVDKKRSTRLEDCRYENRRYTVINRAFVSEDGTTLGREVPLTAVERWAGLEPEITFYDVSGPWFARLKMPQLNHIEQGAPEGVSLFSKATELIREADKQFSRILWEYEGGELAINAREDLFRRGGVKRADLAEQRFGSSLILPKGKERLYRAFGVNDDKFVMETFSPNFRDASLFNGLNRIKREIEFTCGFSYGILSDPQNEDRTATEIRSSKQRFHQTVADIQGAVGITLQRLLTIMDEITTAYNLAPAGDYEVSFQWDDSIVADRQTEFAEKQSLLAAGILWPHEFRAWYLGVDDDSEEARHLPSVLTEE